jgi:hypothetical protein
VVAIGLDNPTFGPDFFVALLRLVSTDEPGDELDICTSTGVDGRFNPSSLRLSDRVFWLV